MTMMPYLNSAIPTSRTVRSYIGSTERPVARQTNYIAAMAAAAAPAPANQAASNVPPSASAAATSFSRPLEVETHDSSSCSTNNALVVVDQRTSICSLSHLTTLEY